MDSLVARRGLVGWVVAHTGPVELAVEHTDLADSLVVRTGPVEWAVEHRDLGGSLVARMDLEDILVEHRDRFARMDFAPAVDYMGRIPLFDKQDHRVGRVDYQEDSPEPVVAGYRAHSGMLRAVIVRGRREAVCPLECWDQIVQCFPQPPAGIALRRRSPDH